MKTASILMLLFLTASGISFAQTAVSNGPTITFQKDVHDFGTLAYGAPASCVFTYTNTGNAPLVIAEARKSCGCTVPSWTKTPVNPGETGEIKVTYDSKRPGVINKSVTVVSNAENEPNFVLRIKGNIQPQPESGTPVDNTLAPVE